MTPHPLDMPARAALSSRHRPFGLWSGEAACYRPDIVPFATTSPAEPGALARLVAPGDQVAFLETGLVPDLPGFTVLARAQGLQMVAETSFAPAGDPRIRPLTAEDAPDMLALAELTKPGPFTLGALQLGRFWGIHEAGRLVAMAGERMACDGFTEVSGVCAHPEMRGRGLARSLSAHVAGVIQSEGGTAFLHAFATNAAAIGLYGSLGFVPRAEMQVAFMRRLEAPAD
ncbi:GNAT family N-acetyltransferase [Pseudooceanicola sp. C21-150M6]|uniref:GNAT family N-acetyltransferase n=1 Tax=Pseudooceanicola sp. C21-150M6 TaxID=3434355 RepID=UPI003D7FBCA2